MVATFLCAKFHTLEKLMSQIQWFFWGKKKPKFGKIFQVFDFFFFANFKPKFLVGHQKE